MTEFSSHKDLYALAKLLAKKFKLEKFKSFLVEHELFDIAIWNEPFGKFSKIVVKEEYIRETLFVLDGEKFSKMSSVGLFL